MAHGTWAGGSKYDGVSFGGVFVALRTPLTQAYHGTLVDSTSFAITATGTPRAWIWTTL